MCKFCDSKKPTNILKYDNLDSMSVSYGQYKGVSIFSDVTMHGDMLSLSANGNYRSSGDCYYEDCGLECDGVNAHHSAPTYINIKYCPFCGKELKKGVYDIQVANDRIKVLEEEIKRLKQDLNCEVCVVSLTWKSKNSKYEEYREENTLSEIMERFVDVKGGVMFGVSKSDRMYFNTTKGYPVLTPETKIQCGTYCTPKYYANQYQVKEAFFDKLVEYGIVGAEKKDKGFEKLKKNVNRIKKDIIKKNAEIKELKERIKQLKID